jgi:NAD(P)-dependent dehydrogenase (short-subunit alcohol dehydrogenase family)
MRGDGVDTAIADSVVDEITRAGGRAVASHDSVDTAAGDAAIAETAVDAFGRLDAVVSNAGIFGSVAFEDLSHDDWTRMLRVHLDGGFHLSQPAYRVMKANGGGRFVFVSSSAGVFGQPMEAHYAAAKTGLIGLTNVIAIEGEAHGILANAVLPTGFSLSLIATIRPVRDATPARPSGSVTAGWLADADAEPAAEDIAEHLEQISATEEFIVPTSIVDQVLEVCDRLGVSPMPGGADVEFPEPQKQRS